MRIEPEVTNVSFHVAPADQIDSGLLGFVAFDLDGHVHIDGVTVRRTRRGCLVLSFPAPRKRALVAPLDQEIRTSIERQVFDALRLTGETL